MDNKNLKKAAMLALALSVSFAGSSRVYAENPPAATEPSENTSGENSQAERVFVDGKFKYTVEGADIAYISAYTEASPEEIVIPATLGGKKVEFVGEFLTAEQAKTVKKIVFPEGVTGIEWNLFRETKVENIEFPSTITSFFGGVGRKFNTITISEGIKEIPAGLFINTNAKNFVLPNSVKTIKNNSFRSADIDKFTLPSNLEKIEALAFASARIGEINVPKSVNDASGAFQDVGEVRKVKLEDGTTTIPAGLFMNAKADEVVIPKSVKKIPYGTFRNSEITKLNLSDGLLEIGDYAFAEGKNNPINLPDTVKEIRDRAFYNNIVSEIILPKNLERIGKNAFEGTNIKELYLPSNLKELDEESLYGASKLNKVSFGKNTLIKENKNHNRNYKALVYKHSPAYNFVKPKGMDYELIGKDKLDIRRAGLTSSKIKDYLYLVNGYRFNNNSIDFKVITNDLSNKDKSITIKVDLGKDLFISTDFVLEDLKLYMIDGKELKEIKDLKVDKTERTISFTGKDNYSYILANKVKKVDEYVRIAGENRIETSIKVSKEYYPSADTVIVVRADLFPDALSASVLAAGKKAPLLLSDSDSLDTSIKAEIKRLKASNIIVIGGENAISKDVEKELQKLVTNKIKRIAGKNRYETSANVALELKGKLNKQANAIFADGNTWADALAAGSLAAREKMPILLVDGKQIEKSMEKAIKELGIKGSYIIGGTARVSNEFAKKLPAIKARYAGPTRYETAVEIAKANFKGQKEVFLVSGESFADSLIIGAVAGAGDKAILLTESKELPKAVANFMKSEKVDRSIIIGGRARITEAIEKQLLKK